MILEKFTFLRSRVSRDRGVSCFITCVSESVSESVAR